MAFQLLTAKYWICSKGRFCIGRWHYPCRGLMGIPLSSWESLSVLGRTLSIFSSFWKSAGTEWAYTAPQGARILSKHDIMMYCVIWIFLHTILAWKKPLTDWDQLISDNTCNSLSTKDLQIYFFFVSCSENPYQSNSYLCILASYFH